MTQTYDFFEQDRQVGVLCWKLVDQAGDDELYTPFESAQILDVVLGARHEYHFLVVYLQLLESISFKFFLMADVGMRTQNVLK